MSIEFLTAEQASETGMCVATGKTDEVLRSVISEWKPPWGGKVCRAQFLMKIGDRGIHLEDDEIEIGVVVDIPSRPRGKSRMWGKIVVNERFVIGCYPAWAMAQYIHLSFTRLVEWRLESEAGNLVAPMGQQARWN